MVRYKLPLFYNMEKPEQTEHKLRLKRHKTTWQMLLDMKEWKKTKKGTKSAVNICRTYYIEQQKYKCFENVRRKAGDSNCFCLQF